ncbi:MULTISPECIES: aminoglycoside 6'-N-acetyltransferase [Rhizobium]|uniref:Aminoglycoside N(6')-acetyltransferase type 1 n=1 Tax=Rhizobium tropici TaxID=398 RepID=A0A329YK76_RHITR|nr:MULTISPECIES: aminoglycoside 6'-N-acetyltransferase [Rhizobium]MBB3287844.1 aminoglycoside 6'-N-acetyltransferase I [Rhizobium sp. BK252]MBB3402552.1 aminoglycoside 6'-N-acetyltransferase I [Rhizobium sp. BK289]MBB3415128.1 aminoglycoside 6'-N-acetyltransferase I [Rhizobium sp. BK284]MBB3483017.1 aminoglycoside 6'-N-acetyltransferase I [Rhizobium sp. BK347]MDK4720642.1 GNAT family N-acetyltransferase [Rhizobium sp. CNPSo 3968]
MRIEKAGHEHLEGWVGLRAALWPGHSVEHHRAELAQFCSNENGIAFVAIDAAGHITGFAEATLRHDYVNGCETSPVLFLEGIYVRPENRREGVAQALCEAVAAWGREAGCTEFASDALIDNLASHAFHAALGFVETRRVVYFRKLL